MSSYNRLHNVNNPNQGDAKRVLCVCSAGLLRSPTIAWILSNKPFNFNTRSAGAAEGYALVLVDEVLLKWADVIVFADQDHKRMLSYQYKDAIENMETHVLNIPDMYAFRDPKLVTMAKRKLKEIFPTDLSSTG